MSVENANELQVLSDLNVKKLQNVAKKKKLHMQTRKNTVARENWNGQDEGGQTKCLMTSFFPHV